MQYKNTYTLKDCVMKHMATIFNLSKKPVEVSFRGHKEVFGGAREIKVSPNFYRSIKCQGCGQCCRRYYCIWDNDSQLSSGILGFTESVEIDGVSTFLIYTQPPEDKEYHCRFAEPNPVQMIYRCRIYEKRPLESRMPHIFFNNKNEVLTITKRQFGRNHRLKCKAPIKEFNYKEFSQEDMATINYLRKCILIYQKPEESHIDDLIQLIESGVKSWMKD